ncbi:MAG: hypothetical protein ACU83N_10240 [Gammaproteobacteria bacterium]
MKQKSSLIESEPDETSAKQIHPLIQLGLAAAGTQIGASMIIKLAKHPLLLLSMGIASGFYLNKYRKGVREAADQIKEQGLKMIKKKADD